jgi:hypothetical protein
MPFVRLGAAFGLTYLGDLGTGELVARGATLDPFVVMAVRLLTSVIVLRFPLAGSLIALEADKWDWFWLGMGNRPGAEQAVYQQWDKCLDMVFLGLATIVVLRWPDRRLAALALFAFAWRTVGVVVLLVTQREDILVAFPNVIETLFLVAVVARVLTGSGTVFDSWPMAVAAFIALLVPKTGEEVFLHAFHGRPWDMWPMPGISSMAQAYLWGIAMYLPPAGVVGWLWLTSRRRPPKTDPEEAMAAV